VVGRSLAKYCGGNRVPGGVVRVAVALREYRTRLSISRTTHQRVSMVRRYVVADASRLWIVIAS
jgi:hypothetical protein